MQTLNADPVPLTAIAPIRNSLLSLEQQAQSVVTDASAAYTAALQGKKDAKTVHSLDPGRHRHLLALIKAARAQGDLMLATAAPAPSAPVAQAAGQSGASESAPK